MPYAAIARTEARLKTKHAGGRPLRWNKPEELEAELNQYVIKMRETGEIMTMSGLALFLGVDVDTIRNYCKKDEFFYVFKKARLIIQQTCEQYMFSGRNPIGAIFLMKNHFSNLYKDRQEIAVTHETIDNVLQKAEHREIIDGEVIDETQILAQPSENIE